VCVSGIFEGNKLGRIYLRSLAIELAYSDFQSDQSGMKIQVFI